MERRFQKYRDVMVYNNLIRFMVNFDLSGWGNLDAALRSGCDIIWVFSGRRMGSAPEGKIHSSNFVDEEKNQLENWLENLGNYKLETMVI